MGRFRYDDTLDLHIDDDLLRHIESVTRTKLDRNESFMIRWTTLTTRSGQMATWISNHDLLRFGYEHPEPDRLNTAWISILRLRADSSNGLILTGTPGNSFRELVPTVRYTPSPERRVQRQERPAPAVRLETLGVQNRQASKETA